MDGPDRSIGAADGGDRDRLGAPGEATSYEAPNDEASNGAPSSAPATGEPLPPELAALLRTGPGAAVDPDIERPAVPDSPESRALDAERDEIRRMVAAGASSQEELRAIADRLRAHRAREEQHWRGNVKPTLRRTGFDSPGARRSLLIGAGVIGCVLVVVLAAATGNVLIVLAPLVAAVVAAYVVGSRRSSG